MKRSMFCSEKTLLNPVLSVNLGEIRVQIRKTLLNPVLGR